MYQPLNMTIARKTVTQFPNPDARLHEPVTPAVSIPFGEPERRLPSIDALSTRSGYDSDVAYMMAIISAWAYADEQVLAAKLRYYGFGTCRIRRVTVQNNALLVVTTAYLVQSESGKTAVLAFRGTDPGDYLTVLTDLQVMQRPFAGGSVHLGFYQSVEVVWSDVDAALSDARDGKPIAPDPKVAHVAPLESLYVTGHSLGGAMALLATARLFMPRKGDGDYAWLQRKFKGLYTYGQPMVGDHRFANFCTGEFGSLIFRHVFKNDFIPHLPPESSFEYAHAGPELRASTANGPWTWDHAQSDRIKFPGLVSVFVNALESRVSAVDRFPGYSIDDHMPLGYLEVSKKTRTPAPASLTRRSVLSLVTGLVSGQ